MKQIGSKQIAKEIAYGVVALALLVGVWLLTYRERQTELPVEEYEIVVFGDSVLRFTQEEDSANVVERMNAILGDKVFNGSLGGTCMSRVNTSNELGYTKDGLSMVSLARAIYMQDFGVPKTVRIKESSTEYFEDTILALEAIDYSKTKVVMIEHCFNDYHAGVPIENADDAYDPYTYAGALRSSIRYIQEAYPDIRIILVTPTFSWYTVPHQTCEEMNEGGGVLEDYVNAQMQVAEEMNVEIIDIYHDFYQHETWEDYLLYTADGLHPNETGCAMIAERLAAYLLENPN